MKHLSPKYIKLFLIYRSDFEIFCIWQKVNVHEPVECKEPNCSDVNKFLTLLTKIGINLGFERMGLCLKSQERASQLSIKSTLVYEWCVLNF